METLNDTVGKVAAQQTQWSSLTARAKRDILLECMSCLADSKLSEEYRQASLHRRGLDKQDAIGTDAYKQATAEVAMLSTVHLASWLTYYADAFDKLAHGPFACKAERVASNYDGSIRVDVTPNDAVSSIASCYAQLELHINDSSQILLQQSTIAKATNDSGNDISATTGAPSATAESQTDATQQPEMTITTDAKKTDCYSGPMRSVSKLKSRENVPIIEQFNPTALPEGCTLILGPSNFDAPVDILSVLFYKNHVCIYKCGQPLECLLPVFQKIFKPLVVSNYLTFVKGGAEIGNELLQNPLITDWLLIGQRSTALNILWGDHDTAARAAAAYDSSTADKNNSTTTATDAASDSATTKEPVVQLSIAKPFCAELGSCAPYIVCPNDTWSPKEISYHANMLAFSMLFNGGHVCVHPQVIVTCKNWKHRETFINSVQKALKAADYTGCFLPFAAEKVCSTHKRLKELDYDVSSFEVPMTKPIVTNTPLAKSLGHHDEDCCGSAASPFCKTIFHVGSADAQHFMLTEEAFGPCSMEYVIDCPPNAKDFLPIAVHFVNAKTFGNLAGSVICKVDSDADQKALDTAVVDLHYGSVVVNAGASFGIQFPQLAWGAYPQMGHPTVERIVMKKPEGMSDEMYRDELRTSTLAAFKYSASGVGSIGNCLGYKNITKSVARFPFYGYQLVFHSASKGRMASSKAKAFQSMSSALCRRRPPSMQGYFSSAASAAKSLSELTSAFVF